MDDLLKDELNLRLLKEICSGNGVDVNLSELSRKLNKHRNTIRDRVEDLFKYKIINRPIYPFYWLYSEYPLMVLDRTDLPRDEITNKFIEEDPHIFAAFFKKDEEYNTLLIEYHKDIASHLLWRESLINENKLPPRETRYLSDAMFFSTKNFIKYNFSHMINIIEEDKVKHKGILNRYKLDELSFQILKKLNYGEGIHTNEHYLAEKLGFHRKTIERRIKTLLKKKIILTPTCRFPRLLVPPDYTLVLSLIEIKKQCDKVIKVLQNDPHISFILGTSMGRYTHLIFSSFFLIKDHLQWEEDYDQRFSKCIGAVKNKYLSPSMMFSIDQQTVFLEIINKHIKQIKKSNN